MRRPGVSARRIGGLMKAAGLLLALWQALSPAPAAASPSASLGLTFRVHQASAPSDITDLTATPAGSPGSIQLSWTEPGASGFSGTASSYTLRVSTIGNITNDADFNNPLLARPLSDFSPSPNPVPGVGGTLRSDVVIHLTPGVKYFFALHATNAEVPPGTSSWVRGAGRNTNNFAVAPEAAPSVPTGLAINMGGPQALLSWNPNPEWDLAYYRLWRAQGSTPTAGSFSPIAVTAATGTLDAGLVNGVTYYYRLSAVEIGPDALESALSPWTTGYPRNFAWPIVLTDVLADGMAQTIQLDWTNPNSDPKSTLILRRAGQPPSQDPLFGSTYQLGDLIGGATVVFKASGLTFTDSGLPKNTTWFYALYDISAPFYSVAVTTAVYLHVAPMPPAGLDRTLPPGTQSFGAIGVSTQVTITWAPVVAARDGTPFSRPPTGGELASYRLYRSTGLYALPDETVVLPSTVTSWVDATGGADHYYKLTAVDGYGVESEGSMWIAGAAGDLWKPAPLGDYLLHILRPGVPVLNSQLATLSVWTTPNDLLGRVLYSATFSPYRTDNAKPLPADFMMPDASVETRFYYQVHGSFMTFSPQAVVPVTTDMGVFWHNGKDWFKMYGNVDPAGRRVWVMNQFFGRYQVRQLLRTEQFSFDPSTLTQRFLTPNGDGKNDDIVFKVNNPASVAVTGKIFDVRGAVVSDIPYDELSQTLTWDGKSNGTVVPGGVYIYQIEAEGKTYTGTVVVIR